MKEAVIVAGVRTAVGKAPRGTLRTTRPDDMAATVIEDLLRRIPELSPESIDDVILDCATPEGESGTNVARISALRAGLPRSVPAVTVNRFCSSGSQTIAMASERIMAGMAGCIIAGGTESMSMLRGNTKFRPNPYLVEKPLRHGDDVCRRRPGCGYCLRESTALVVLQVSTRSIARPAKGNLIHEY